MGEIKTLDWSNVKFIARKDTWYLENSKVRISRNEDGSFADCQYNDKNDKVENNIAVFEGWTYKERYKDNPNIDSVYESEKIEYDEEQCDFNEFDIYWENELINDWPIYKLQEKISEKLLNDFIINLKSLDSDEDRINIFKKIRSSICLDCGDINDPISCQCWNDN